MNRNCGELEEIVRLLLLEGEPWRSSHADLIYRYAAAALLSTASVAVELSLLTAEGNIQIRLDRSDLLSRSPENRCCARCLPLAPCPNLGALLAAGGVKSPATPMMHSAATQEVLAHPFELTAAAVAGCHPSLKRATDYIFLNYATRLTLSEVAVQAYISASRLSHLFRRDLRTSFSRFLAAARVSRARVLLAEHPTRSVTEIAGAVGFDDLRSFERYFKRLTGVPALAWRKRRAPTQ